MKRSIPIWTAAMLLSMGATAFAQHGHSSAPKPTQTHAAKPPQAHVTTQTHTTKPTQTHAAKPTQTHAVKPPQAHGTKPVKPTTAKAPKGTPHTTGNDHAAKTATSGTKTTTGTTSSTVTLTPVQQKLQKNTNLASKLQGRLPAGTDLMTASSGFRNLGQFVAAVNVSNNLGIPFAQLKTRMVDDGMSLGQSIQALKPTANSSVEAGRAEHDADVLIQATVTTTSSTSTTTTAPTTKKSKKTTSGS